MMPAEGIEHDPPPVAGSTEVADSKRRQRTLTSKKKTTGTYLEHIFFTATAGAKRNSAAPIQDCTNIIAGVSDARDFGGAAVSAKIESKACEAIAFVIKKDSLPTIFQL
jgi:hypothetical protein